jgi:outer membrane protein OmpU
MSFGASVGIDRNISGETGAADAVANDDMSAFVSGAFGKLSMGNLDAATDGMGIGDVGHQGIGVDEVAELNKVAGGDADTSWAYSVNGLDILIGYDSTTENTSAKIGFSVGTVALAVGVSNADDGANDDDTTTAIQASTTLNGVSLAAYYGVFDDASANTETDSFGLQASFALDDATTITAVYGDNDDATEAAYGIGASMNLGGGLSLAGGVGSVGDDSRWDLGLNMSF